MVAGTLAAGTGARAEVTVGIAGEGTLAVVVGSGTLAVVVGSGSLAVVVGSGALTVVVGRGTLAVVVEEERRPSWSAAAPWPSSSEAAR